VLEIIIEDSDEHPQNADSPIDVTLSGIIIEDIDKHPQKVRSPIDVTLFGITIDDIHRFPKNSSSANSVTPCAITISLFWSVDVAIVDRSDQSHNNEMLQPVSWAVGIKTVRPEREASV
jgi:hypothetical protein